jgi:hypothetical protein
MGATCGGSWTIRSCHVDRIVGTVGTVDTKKEHDPGDSAYHFRFQLTFPSRMIGRKRRVFFRTWAWQNGPALMVEPTGCMGSTWRSSRDDDALQYLLSKYLLVQCKICLKTNRIIIYKLGNSPDPIEILLNHYLNPIFHFLKLGCQRVEIQNMPPALGPGWLHPWDCGSPTSGNCTLGGPRNMPMTPENYPVGSLDSADKHFCVTRALTEMVPFFLRCWWTFWNGTTQNDWWRIMAVCCSIRTGSRWTTMKLYETPG